MQKGVAFIVDIYLYRQIPKFHLLIEIDIA